MSSLRRFQYLALLVVAGLVAGCGDKRDSGNTQSQSTVPGGGGAAGSSLDPAAAPFADMIAAAGFRARMHRAFPAVTKKKGAAVVYTDKAGKRGGVLYTQRTEGDTVDRIVWHWYFSAAAPDSIQPIELNGDGLWDARIFLNDGKIVDFVQDVDYTMYSSGRHDFIATNGPASPATNLWLCFDGDSTTAWSAGDGAYIDLSAPFGVQDRILMIQLLGDHQPASIDILADGRPLQTVQLGATNGKQKIQLGAGAASAAQFRIVPGKTSDGTPAAIAEVSIR